MRLTLIIGFLLFSYGGSAQLDTTYIDKMKGVNSVQTYTAVRSIPFLLRSRLDLPSGTPRSAIFVPNAKILQGVGFTWKWLTLKYAFETPLTFLERSRFGGSDFFNLGVNINTHFLHMDLEFRRNAGYSDINQENYDSNWFDGKDYFHRRDTKAFQLSGNTVILFSSKYSYNANFNFKGRQKKSAISFLMQGTLRHQRLFSDTLLIAPQMEEAFGRWGDLLETRTTLVGIMPGFGAALVKNNWFWSPMISGGPALQIHRNFTYTRENVIPDIGPVLDARFSAGYNGEKFYTGLIGAYEFNFVFLRDLFHMSYYNNISWHIGYRF